MAAHMLSVRLNCHRRGFDEAHAFDVMRGPQTTQNISYMGHNILGGAQSIELAAQIMVRMPYSEAHISSFFV